MTTEELANSHIDGMQFCGLTKVVNLGARFANNERGFLGLTIQMDTIDADDEAPFTLQTWKGVPKSVDVTDREVTRRWVWDALVEFWLHELAEGLLFDGERYREPHPARYASRQ